jgi:Tfp pilus assembly protein PilE
MSNTEVVCTTIIAVLSILSIVFMFSYAMYIDSKRKKQYGIRNSCE